MFLKRMHDLPKTLSFRLTLWYALIFTVTSLIAFSIFYQRISTITLANTDNELIEEVDEMAVIMAQSGYAHVLAEFNEEVVSEGENKFFRILSNDGSIIESAIAEQFGQIKVSSEAMDALNGKKKYVLQTLKIPDFAHGVRVIYGAIGPMMIYNMGISLKDNNTYLGIFENLIALLMIPLFGLAALIGWFMARQALKGVEEVTQTAIEISKGSVDKRVGTKRRHYEIDRLANTFNDMLDRMQTILSSMREMNDNVAHDLRSPLTRIRGIAEMTIIGNGAIEDYSEMAANTIEECDKLIEMINTMMDITETEAGVGRFTSEPINLVELILSACELFDPIAAEKDVHLVTALPDSLMISGDKSKMQRLITNLIENAIKYNRQGGTVFISAKQKNQQLNIRVEDTGEGIPEAEMPRIFDRFYRCDRSRSQTGIGLGLSLVKAIVKAVGGDIQVSSKLNEGSTFSVSLPV